MEMTLHVQRTGHEDAIRHPARRGAQAVLTGQEGRRNMEAFIIRAELYPN
jgi:hypothetical protein